MNSVQWKSQCIVCYVLYPLMIAAFLFSDTIAASLTHASEYHVVMSHVRNTEIRTRNYAQSSLVTFSSAGSTGNFEHS